jgi:hypothetical protein
MSIRIPIDPASLPIVRRMNPGRIATHQKENFEQDPEPKALRLLGLTASTSMFGSTL